MAIEIPALSSNYPLFEWTDYPGQKSALVSGGMVDEFEKETWNAIVNTLGDALDDAGIEWDATYTTQSGARITAEDKDLYAVKFNSVAHNVNHLLPLHFAWKDEPDSRGYVGKMAFSKGDNVYPEYILELVRKINSFIGILTGENAKKLSMDGELIDTTYDCGGIYQRPSLPVKGEGYSYSDSKETRVRRRNALRFWWEELIETDYDISMRRRIAKYFKPIKQIDRTKSDCDFRRGERKRTRGRGYAETTALIEILGGIHKMLEIETAIVKSKSNAKATKAIAKKVISDDSISKTRFDEGFNQRTARHITGEEIAKAISENGMKAKLSKRIRHGRSSVTWYAEDIRTGMAGRIDYEEIISTDYADDFKKGTSIHAKGMEKSQSRYFDGIDGKRARWGEIRERSFSDAITDAVKSDSLPIDGQGKANSLNVLDFTKADSMPAVSNSFTLSRSVADADSVEGSGLGASGVSGSSGKMNLWSAWYPPVWTENGLLIIQTYDKPMFVTHGLYDVKARGEAKANHEANMDFWYLPRRTEKGLLITQAYDKPMFAEELTETGARGEAKSIHSALFELYTLPTAEEKGLLIKQVHEATLTDETLGVI